MNKIQILTKNVHTFFIERLKVQALQSGVDLILINPWLEKTGLTDVPLLVRTTAIHGSHDDLDFIRVNNFKTIPPLGALETLRTKPLQFDYFRKHYIPHLPWLNLQTCSLEEILHFCQNKGALLIKPQRGQGGWGVRVFEGVSDLLSWWKEAQDREYLLQPYIEDHEEIRIFFMKETKLALKRIKKGVAANFRQDGEAQVVAVPVDLGQIVEKIASDLDLIYGAADFLVTGDGPQLLEMNLVPGIEQLEEVSGRNIAGELLSIFLNH